MRRIAAFVGAVLVVVACGGTTDPKKDPAEDPYIAVRVFNGLDTTTRPGRAVWRVYALLSGPQPNQNGIGYVGFYSIGQARLSRPYLCMQVGADSIGQRLFAPFAIADTTTESAEPITAVDSIAQRWNAGNHTPPASRYLILTLPPTDAWVSQQFDAGHGRLQDDPIKWSWDWQPNLSTTLVERFPVDTSTTCKGA